MTDFFDLVRQDYSDVYATATIRGTYIQEARCRVCKLAARKRVPPLIIEWEKGSDVIGDFTWPGGLEEVVLRESVRDALMSNHPSGVRFDQVEMIQKDGLKIPRKPAKMKNRVWLPYLGPPLWSLDVTSWCRLDIEKSKRSIVIECTECERSRMVVHDSTAPLVIKTGTWDGSEFFKIREFGNLVFAVARVSRLISESGFSNVEMKLRGSI